MEQTRPQQPAPSTLPDASNDNTVGIVRTPHETASPQPMHPNTQSNLTPTSEFLRILLLALPTRYLARGPAKIAFRGDVKAGPQQMVYALAMGIGSAALSLKYGALVKHDIKNIFSEAVALEKNTSPHSITFADIQASDNRIVQSTMKTFRQRMFQRLATDALFFLAAPLVMLNKGFLADPGAKEGVVDTLVGVKGAMALRETWNRKTTLFEDLVTFITNKINPRNGLGQPITLGEVFDLFQHYADAFESEKMFRNVLSKNATGRWSHSQPIFQRITDLMNETYAYKHTTPADYEAAKVSGSDFPLPKLIYMLGHGMIDPDRPERTLALVEIMNAKDGAAVTHAIAQMDQGIAPAAVLKQLGLHYVAPEQKKHDPSIEPSNGVIAKGSTMQLERAPLTSIDAGTASTAQLATQAAALVH